MNNTGVEITAGLGGFLVLFALGLAIWFLGRDLSRRLRRMRQNEQLRLEREAQPGGDTRESGPEGEGTARP